MNAFARSVESISGVEQALENTSSSVAVLREDEVNGVDPIVVAVLHLKLRLVPVDLLVLRQNMDEGDHDCVEDVVIPSWDLYLLTAMDNFVVRDVLLVVVSSSHWLRVDEGTTELLQSLASFKAKTHFLIQTRDVLIVKVVLGVVQVLGTEIHETREESGDDLRIGGQGTFLHSKGLAVVRLN